MISHWYTSFGTCGGMSYSCYLTNDIVTITTRYRIDSQRNAVSYWQRYQRGIVLTNSNEAPLQLTGHLYWALPRSPGSLSWAQHPLRHHHRYCIDSTYHSDIIQNRTCPNFVTVVKLLCRPYWTRQNVRETTSEPLHTPLTKTSVENVKIFVFSWRFLSWLFPSQWMTCHRYLNWLFSRSFQTRCLHFACWNSVWFNKKIDSRPDFPGFFSLALSFSIEFPTQQTLFF